MHLCSDIKWTFVWINLLNGQFAQVYCLWDSIMDVYHKYMASLSSLRNSKSTNVNSFIIYEDCNGRQGNMHWV